jgi:hypothetical protein
VAQWHYSVEHVRPEDTFGNTPGRGGVEVMLNLKAAEGWLLVESHPAPDGDGRLYVFRREVPPAPGAAV